MIVAIIIGVAMKNQIGLSGTITK